MALPNKVRTNVARNLRRQIDTKIRQAQKAIDTAKSAFLKKSYERKISRLEEAKKMTYITTRNDDGKRVTRSETDIRQGMQTAARELSQSRYLSERGRRSLAATETQLNAASSDRTSVYTKADIKIFDRATQKAWDREGVSIQERNQAILAYYGYENLADLVADVLALNQKAVDKANQMYAKRQTEEQDEFADENDVREAAQYPMYLRDVISMAEPSGLSEIEKTE